MVPVETSRAFEYAGADDGDGLAKYSAGFIDPGEFEPVTLVMASSASTGRPASATTAAVARSAA